LFKCHPAPESINKYDQNNYTNELDRSNPTAYFPGERKVAMSIAPGLLLCLLVTAAAYGLEAAEAAVFGKPWLEALVLAILIGTIVRSLWTPGARVRHGVAFSAKYLLEVAVMLLGASVSAATILAAGPVTLFGIVGIVALAIPLSFAIGRVLGLPQRMALLIACGNSICGNSAIAAVAPVIGADGDDIAASIAFTAVLGVLVVLGLPLLAAAIGMGAIAYGAFAGLTVYAVPQVLAATAPFGAGAMQIGTLVKLVRVLMLGPVCLVLSLIAPRLTPTAGSAAATSSHRPSRMKLVPWFIIGFVILVIARSLGMIPDPAALWSARLATLLTVISMAALGLTTDLRTVAKAGGRVTAAVLLSLGGLGLISFLFLTLHPLG
jgi:uncharacterized integral membrane protein (TIGR00698 family)